jgi:hypothetical protein
MRRLGVNQAILRATLEALQGPGRSGREAVVLWMGDLGHDVIRVVSVHVPVQHATDDMFTIPRASVVSLLEVVGRTGLSVVAQVHTHPNQAFHSAADDRWAIVRHEGAVSIVLPRFALDTDVATFWRDAVIFQLNGHNKWLEVPESRRRDVIAEES